MDETLEATRTRREFLTTLSAASAGWRSPPCSREERGAAPAPALPKAKSVIFLFMAGGPSHLETFDPKPLLNKLTASRGRRSSARRSTSSSRTTPSCSARKRTFQKHGQSGIEVSDLFPHTAECIDDIAVIRSCHGDMVVHSAAQYELFTGRVVPGFPSMGSWVVYGLGSESESLPAYVVMPDPHGALEAGQPMYANGFLPAVYQPTMFRAGDAAGAATSICPRASRWTQRREDGRADPRAEPGRPRAGRRGVRRPHQRLRPGVQDADRGAGGLRPLAASRRRRSTSTASAQSRPTTTAAAACWRGGWSRRACGSSCVVSGGGPGNMQWDAHSDIEENHLRMAGADRSSRSPALLQGPEAPRPARCDAGAVGRRVRPLARRPQGGKGRDHHNLGFTMWLAGGGIKGGQVVGATDAIGLRAVEEPLPLPRHPHHDPAPARPRPGRADLPAPGRQRAADGGAGQGDHARSFSTMKATVETDEPYGRPRSQVQNSDCDDRRSEPQPYGRRGRPGAEWSLNRSPGIGATACSRARFRFDFFFLKNYFHRPLRADAAHKRESGADWS